MSSFISFVNVEKRYGTGEVSVQALHDASFIIEKGEICVIVGPSGAGKTTLLNILGGMDTLTSGQVFLDGREVSAFNSRQLADYRRRDIGFVFQFYNLIPNLTALENVEIASQIVKDPLPAAQVLQDVGLGYIKLGQSSSTLSGGESQRVKLASFLTKDSAQGGVMFIFDEPTTGLHFHDINKLLAAFNALIERGHTIVIVEHNMDVIKCADWVVDLGPEAGTGGGGVVFEGTPRALEQCPESYTGKFLSLRTKL